MVGGHVDDLAAAALLEHLGDHRSAHEVFAFEVGPHHPLVVGDRLVQVVVGHADPALAGVADQDVDAAEGFDRPVHHLAHVLGHGHVGLPAYGPDAMGLQAGGQLENLFTNVANGDVDPFSGKRFRIGRTNADGGARNDGVLATQ